MDLGTKKTVFLTPDTADVDEFELSPDGATIAFVATERGVSVLRLFDTASRTEKPGPKLPLGIIRGVRWHEDGGILGFTMGTARANYDCYSWDLRSGKLERWTGSELGGLNADTFSEPELVAWKSFDGREITGFLYRPDAAKFPGKRPVVVDIHGGPEGQARAEFMGRDNFLMSELGVAMILPNVRGSTGYGKTFSQLDNGFLREGTYKDIAALFDWIATRPDLDASRVMVQGGSYGGHMTLAVATFYSGRIRCAVDVVGPSNLVTFLEHTSGYRRDLRRVEYGDERDPKMRAFLEKIAPANNAEKIQKPLFVIQGANDPRVPLSESVQMVQKIRGVGTPVIRAGCSGSSDRPIIISSQHTCAPGSDDRSGGSRERSSPICLAGRHHGPRDAGHLVGQSDRHQLARPALQQGQQPGRGAARLGVSDDRRGPEHQQLAQPLVAGPADAAHALLAAAGVLARRQPDPGGQVAAGLELPRVDPYGQRQCADRPDAGNLGQQPADRVGLVLRHQRRVELGDLAVEMRDLLPQEGQQAARGLRYLGILRHRRQQLGHPAGAAGHHHAELSGMAAQRVDGLGALGHQQLAGAQSESIGLLGGRLDRHPAHRWPASGLADRLGVVPVSLAALDERLDVLRRDQPHPVAQLA